MPLPPQVWGNARGWVVAGLLVAAVGLVLVSLGRAGAMTPTTELAENAAIYAPFSLPFDPALVLEGSEFDTVDADTGGVFLEAARAYLGPPGTFESRRPYDAFLRRPPERPVPADALPALEGLTRAARGTRATLFADRPQLLINYAAERPELEALHTLGQVALRQASLHAAQAAPLLRNDTTDPAGRAAADEARRLYQTALVLGMRLYEERLTFRQLDLGQRLIGGALSGLVGLTQVNGDVMANARAREARDKFQLHATGPVRRLSEAINTINDVSRTDDPADVHAGDVAAIAASADAAPVWRVEAILRLGAYRIDATRPGDREGADRLVRALANDPDPRIRLAAAAAANLTERERRTAR